MRRILLGWLGIELGLAAVTLAIGVYRGRVPALIDFDAEANLVVWFSSTQLLLASFVAGVAAALSRLSGERRGVWLGWTAIAVICLYLSIDETALLHEQIGSFGVWRLGLDLSVGEAWVVLLGPLMAFVGAWMVYWSTKILGWRTLAGAWSLAATLCWIAVPILEVIGPNSGYPFLALMMEETAELIGATLFMGSALFFLDEDRLALRGIALWAARYDRNA